MSSYKAMYVACQSTAAVAMLQSLLISAVCYCCTSAQIASTALL
jgi:hypothetical protein